MTLTQMVTVTVAVAVAVSVTDPAAGALAKQVVVLLNPDVAYMSSQNAVSSLPFFLLPGKKTPASDILSPHPVTHLQDKLSGGARGYKRGAWSARSVSMPWS